MDLYFVSPFRHRWLYSAGEAYLTASFDSLPWEHSKSITALHELMPTLPFFQPVFLAGLVRCLETWERFTTEFADDGLIARSTPLERFTPSTNDANEGSLGETRLETGAHPTQTIELTSAKIERNHNGTEKFMKVFFGPDDHRSVMATQRVAEASGASGVFRDLFLDASAQAVATKRAAAEKKARLLAEKMARLAAVGLVLDESVIRRMLDAQLQVQLEVYRTIVKDTEVPIKARLKRKPERLEQVIAALQRYKVYVSACFFPPESVPHRSDLGWNSRFPTASGTASSSELLSLDESDDQGEGEDEHGEEDGDDEDEEEGELMYRG